MSMIRDIQVTMVQHANCELDKLAIGELRCANDMLWERIETENRVYALRKLIAKGDAQYATLIDFLYEQIKELNVKLTTKIN